MVEFNQLVDHPSLDMQCSTIDEISVSGPGCIQVSPGAEDAGHHQDITALLQADLRS